MDHVLDIEGGWFPRKPEQHFGPHVEWREYSFFQNPRMPAAVNNSRLLVELCSSGAEGCSDGSATPTVQAHRIKVQPGRNSDQLTTLLKAGASYKVLEFSNLASLWPPFSQEGGWFTKPEQHRAFVERLKQMTSVSCCLATSPGWVWYDMLWDVPHTDRFNR
ncbi:uncharacterized protein HaLaN_19354, partial [Haematococcus lacustris]